MAESSLSLGYPELVIAVAEFAGFDPDSDNHSAAQTARIGRIIDAGLRRFYRAHSWNFLNKVSGSVSFTADDYDYDLPDDCISINGPITVDDDAEGYSPIVQRGTDVILGLRQRDNSLTGFPRYYAIRATAHAGTTGQRYEIIVWPTPDGSYTGAFTYTVQAGQVSTSAPYPYGGMTHAEAIRAAVLAAAELDLFREQGPQENMWREALATSIRRDAELSPGNYGPNTDESDRAPARGLIDKTFTVTYS